MKRIAYIISLAVVLCAALSGCVEQLPEVTDTLYLDRCLSPTEATAPIDRTDGKTVSFTWTESKGATQYTVEIFTGAEDADAATVFAGTPTYTEVVKNSPFVMTLPSDLFYFARVKAQAPDTGIEDSKWKEFPYPIGTYEVKSNLWPEVVTRTPDAVTVKWTEIDADRVDHIRVSPNPDKEDTKAYKKYDVAASEAEQMQMTLNGLEPSVKYTIAVHYKSANRGEVQAWTRPSLENPTVVRNSEELRNALKDGAPIIKISYSDTPYKDICEINADGTHAFDNNGNHINFKIGVGTSGTMAIYGEATEDGKNPVVVGGFLVPDGLKSLHIESVDFEGSGYTYTHPIVFESTVTEAVDEVSMLNCNVSGYRAGFFFNEKGAGDITKLYFNNLCVTDILGNGGNGFDIRSEISIGSIEISESTFSQGFRTFFRIDLAHVSSIVIRNNTFNDICFVEDGNNQGLFYLGTAKGKIEVPVFELTDNLFLNLNGNATRTIMFKDEIALPTKMSNNWYYKLGDGFWKSEKVKVGDKEETINAAGKGKLTQTEGLAGGGQILSSDPCYDSAEGNVYVKNAAVLEAKVGDPRWLQPYREVEEDLTLTPVEAGKSWNLVDTKTFGKTVKKSMVRDNLRFIVGSNQFKVSEKGLEFTAAGVVESVGVPSDAAVAFMVDVPGTVILSSVKSNTGSANGHITVAVGPADGSKAQVAGSVNVGVAKAKVALPNVDGPQIVYLYGCSPVILTALQWSDQVESGATPVLGTPEAVASKPSVNEDETDEVKLSWAAVSSAGSYKIYVNVQAGAEELPEAYAEVTGTEWSIPFKTLGFGKFEFQVQACPASDDMSREPSELSQPVEFEYCEVLKVIRRGMTWANDDFQWMSALLGTEENVKPEWTSYVHNGLEYYANNTIRFPKNDGLYNFQYPGDSFNGKATPQRRYLRFLVDGNGKLSVSIDATADDRHLVVLVGGNEVGKYDAPNTKTEGVTPKVYDIAVTANDGDAIILAADASIRVQSISWSPSSAEGGITPDGSEIADNFVLDFESLNAQIGSVSFEEVKTVDNVTYGAAPKKKMTIDGTKRVKFEGMCDKFDENGIPLYRYVSFKVAKPGTIETHLRSGSSSDDKRECFIILVKNIGGTIEIVELAKYYAPVDSNGGNQIVEITEEMLAGLKEAPTVYMYSSNTVNMYSLTFTAK